MTKQAAPGEREHCLLSASGPVAVIQIPPTGRHRGAAEAIAASVQAQFGTPLPVVEADRRCELPERAGILALGNLADNPVIREQYLRFRTLVDRWYPGPDGWLLQSLFTARPSDRGMLIVGGSDDAGVVAAAGQLRNRIGLLDKPTLPWTLDVQLGEGHVPLPEDRIDTLGTSASAIITPQSAIPDGPYRSAYRGGNVRDHLLRLGMFGPHADNSHFSRSSQFGLRYLYTGRPEDAEMYRDTLLREIDLGVIRDLYHYKSVRMFQLWELLAPSSAFTDDQRLRITEAIRQYLLEGTGVSAIPRIEAASNGIGIFDRHTACDALNLSIGGALFHRLTGEELWRQRVAVADAYFRSQAGTDVPYTGLTEGYFSYLEVMLEWMLSTCPDRIAGAPHIRLWADRCMGLVTNCGIMLAGAQSEETRFGYSLFRKLAFLLDDGHCLFVANTRHRAVARGNDRVGQFGAGQAYEGDVAPEEPLDMVGLRLFPMNERLRRWKAPNVPAGEGLDRACGRSGWGIEDEYLAVVGVRGGGKVLPNVGALAGYERFGSRFIASPVQALRAPENCPTTYSVVTVTRDGLGAPLHTAAESVSLTEELGVRTLCLRIRTADAYTWHRTFHWLPEEFLLIVDRVDAEGLHALTVSTHWRCAGTMAVNGQTAHCEATSPEGTRSTFFIETDVPDGFRQQPMPQCELDQTPDAGTPDLPVLHTTHEGDSGSTVTSATLMHAVLGHGSPPRYRIERRADTTVVHGPGHTWCFANAARAGTPQITRKACHAWGGRVGERKGGAPGAARAAGRAGKAFELAVPESPVAWCSREASGHLALGYTDGSCELRGTDGRSRWRTRVDSTPTALCFAGNHVIVGTADGTICRVDDVGERVWTYRCLFRHERDFWPWWFLRTPRIGALSAGQCPATGGIYVAAGTGSCALNVLDGDTGRLLRDDISPYGLADLIAPQIMPDGRLCFLVGHRDLTPSSDVRAWPPLAGAPVVYAALCGPEDTRSPGWDMCGCGAFRVAALGIGAVVPDSLLVLRYGTFNQLACYGLAEADPRWMHDLGGTPCALEVWRNAEGRMQVATCDRFGWVVQFDGSGERVASVRIPHHLEGMAVSADRELRLWGGDTLLRGSVEQGFHASGFPGRALGWVKTGNDEGLLTATDDSVLLVR